METNTPSTHTQLPENLILVDREWLEEMKSKCDKLAKEQPHYEIMYNGINDFIIQMESNNSYSLTPILIEAFIDGNLVRKDIDVNKALSEYILLPITLKKK